MTTQVEVKREYRASSANLFSVCPAASYSAQDEVLVNPVDDAGTLGTAVHEAAAHIVMGQPANTEEIATKYALDKQQTRDLEILTAIAAKFWGQYGPEFGPDVYVEQEFKADGLIPMSGHVDIIGQKVNLVRVGDWKTSRLLDANYRA